MIACCRYSRIPAHSCTELILMRVQSLSWSELEAPTERGRHQVALRTAGRVAISGVMQVMQVLARDRRRTQYQASASA